MIKLSYEPGTFRGFLTQVLLGWSVVGVLYLIARLAMYLL